MSIGRAYGDSEFSPGREHNIYIIMTLGDTEVSPLHEEWYELEEIVHGQEPPLPVNLHSKFLMESPMMYANGFNTLCSHNYPL